MQNTIYTSAKPFVKWVGGKTQLLKDIKHALPANLVQTKDIIYVEPFVGGGAVLFWILQQFPNIKRAVINDKMFIGDKFYSVDRNRTIPLQAHHLLRPPI